jgi:RNA polymerase sigma-70 factor, ECF subfamily
LIGRRRDPLADPRLLIRRVYAYVAYRLGEGSEAEDVTGDVFERAVRYRDTYDPAKGEPIAWLIGIARRSIEDSLARRTPLVPDLPESPAPGDLEADTVRRLVLGSAIEHLSLRERELLALRYGGDLTARQIGEHLGLTTNAVEVALHRALARLRSNIVDSEDVRV